MNSHEFGLSHGLGRLSQAVGQTSQAVGTIASRRDTTGSKVFILLLTYHFSLLLGVLGVSCQSFTCAETALTPRAAERGDGAALDTVMV